MTTIRQSLCLSILLLGWASSSQSGRFWQEPELVQCFPSVEVTVDLADYGAIGKQLAIRTLYSSDNFWSDQLGEPGDSLAFYIKDTISGHEDFAGGFLIHRSVRQLYIEDFDRNGHIDVYAMGYTGGNGMNAAKGGIYEITPNPAGTWKATEILFSETVPGLVDVDGDGLWEFTVTSECWTFASSHAAAVLFLAEFFKPDTLHGGYYQANRELANVLQGSIDESIQEYYEKLSTFSESPSRETAQGCAKASERVVAWYIAVQDRERLEAWLEAFEPIFNRLSEFRLGLMFPKYEDACHEAFREFEFHSRGELPKRLEPPPE